VESIDTNVNVADFLLGTKDTSRIAIRMVECDYTYGDLQSASSRLAQYILDAGGCKGNRALLLSENSFFWVVSYLAMLRSGVVCVPLPPTISQEDLSYILEATGARFIFLQARLATKYRFEPYCPILLTDRDVQGLAAGTQIESLDNLLQKKVTEEAVFPRAAPNDLAALMFTSGSTGKPRGVMVSHRNILANTNSIIESLCLREDDSIMAVLPFHYCFGTSLLHTHLRIGGNLVIDTRFMYPEVVLQRMVEMECTGFAGVPSHYQILLRSSGLKKKSFPHLRFLQQAGGHLAPSFVRELRDALPHVQIFVMYGQTEATARLTCLPPESLERKLGSIGKAIPGVRLRILNESGSEIKPGETGEIVVEGDNVTQGYWCAPEETAMSFRQGQLHTGDLATVDDEGFIYIVDRAKEFVKCGGKRISCRQIEDQLMEFDGLIEAAVVGVPDDILGEAVRAVVVPRQYDDQLEERLRLFCKARFPSQVIREFVILQSLPKNSAGKVLRQQLKVAPICSQAAFAANS
jgi:long-chain acyl-CoA synthetase